MTEKAKVYAIDALRDFRPALLKFNEACAAALLSAESDASRAISRLKQDRLPHWKREVRLREDALIRAKTEMNMKKIMRDGEARATVDDIKAVEKAKRRVGEAQEKLEITRRWIRALEQEQDRFVGGVQPLKTYVAMDLERALADLDAMTEALEGYIAIGEKSTKPAAHRAAKEDDT